MYKKVKVLKSHTNRLVSQLRRTKQNLSSQITAIRTKNYKLGVVNNTPEITQFHIIIKKNVK